MQIACSVRGFVSLVKHNRSGRASQARSSKKVACAAGMGHRSVDEGRPQVKFLRPFLCITLQQLTAEADLAVKFGTGCACGLNVKTVPDKNFRSVYLSQITWV
jgi:hypothetical protein